MLKRQDYPKELHIGTEVYRVRFVRKFKTKDTVGECDPETREIRILCGLGPKETLKCFIHEILHAMLDFEHEIEVKHNLIYKLEEPIYQFLRDNVFTRVDGKR